jgi:hypothetical protein
MISDFALSGHGEQNLDAAGACDDPLRIGISFDLRVTQDTIRHD